MPENSAPLEVTPAEARALLDNGAAILVDVREPWEFSLVHLPSSELCPMNTVPAQLGPLEALARDRQLLVLCHHGVRSLHVVEFLRRQGLSNCSSVAGGIHRWRHDLDLSLAAY